jgi:hypothetical protein
MTVSADMFALAKYDRSRCGQQKRKYRTLDPRMTAQG